MPMECGNICDAEDAQPFLNKVFQFGIPYRPGFKHQLMFPDVTV